MRRSLPPLPEINWPQTAHNEIPLWRRACGAYHAFWAWLDLRPKTADHVLQTSPKNPGGRFYNARTLDSADLLHDLLYAKTYIQVTHFKYRTNSGQFEGNVLQLQVEDFV